MQPSFFGHFNPRGILSFTQLNIWITISGFSLILLSSKLIPTTEDLLVKRAIIFPQCLARQQCFHSMAPLLTIQALISEESTLLISKDSKPEHR